MMQVTQTCINISSSKLQRFTGKEKDLIKYAMCYLSKYSHSVQLMLYMLFAFVTMNIVPNLIFIKFLQEDREKKERVSIDNSAFSQYELHNVNI
jgi:hypothetical protein